MKAFCHTSNVISRKTLFPMVLILLVTFAHAVESTNPVDVPDEFGLGERLALVSWLTEHHVAITDPQ